MPRRESWLIVCVFAIQVALAACSRDQVTIRTPEGRFRMSVAVDDDRDGIPSAYELHGFTYSATKGLKLWNGRSGEYFRTDPRRWSTDGDPYSDFMEATGINMPEGVPQPANHPLVAARPVIVAGMEGFEVILNKEVTESEKAATTTSWSHETTNENQVGGKVSYGVEVEGGYSLLGPKGSVKSKASIEASYSHTWVESDSTGGSDMTETARSVKVNPSEAARLKLRMFVENVGPASAREVKLTFNLILGEKVLATVSTDQYTIRQLSRKGGFHSRYPLSGSFAVERSQSGDYIFLSLDELEAIEKKAPLRLDVIQVSAKIRRWDTGTKGWTFNEEWVDFIDEIDSVSVSLATDREDADSQQYWIYAGTSYSPAPFTLKEVISLVMPVETKDEQIWIDGTKDSDWIFLLPEALAEKVSSPDEALDMVMPPDARVLMLSGEGESGPEIRWAEFSKSRDRIFASVEPGALPVTRVFARLIRDGETPEVDLELDEGQAFYTNREPLDFRPEPGGLVVAEDPLGRSVEAVIAEDNDA